MSIQTKKGRGFLYLLLGIVAVLAVAYFFVNRMVSADTVNASQISIPAGFTAYDSKTINSIGLDQIKSNDLILFSFNDPETGFKNWSVYGPDCVTYKSSDLGKCVTTLELTTDLSYYIYNSKSAIKLLKNTLPPTKGQDNLTSGWHLIAWSGNEIRQSDFLKTLSLKDTSNQLNTLDYAIDQGYISTYIFEIAKANNEIIHRQLSNLDSQTNTSTIKSRDNLWVYVLPNDKKFVSFATTDSTNIAKKLSFGINIQTTTTSTSSNITDLSKQVSSMGIGMIRYVNFDLVEKNRKSDLARANTLKTTGSELMGNLLPQGTIQADRNSSILSSKGTKYKTADEVIKDIELYAGTNPNGTPSSKGPQWDKLKTLLIEQYFKGIVIPRVTLYKDAINYWQPWNEPDGKIGNTSWGIPAEALSLITTGKVKNASGVVEFGTAQITGLDGKKYNINNGASGLIKQICPDCKVVSAGFYRNVQQYYTTLNSNNYIDFVDANEVHLNLFPTYSMGYTRYWTDTTNVMKIYDWLCNGRDNCNKPLYSTEMASPGGAKLIETVNNKATGFTMTFSNSFQADDLIKRFVSLPAQGLTKLNWNGYFDSHDARYYGRTCPTSPVDGFYTFDTANALCSHPMKGLLSKTSSGEYIKKPSYTAYQLATSMLNYAAKVEVLKKGNDEHTDVDPIMLFKITDSDGKQKYSAWCEPFWNVNTTDLGKKTWNYEDKTCSKQVDLSEYGVTSTVSTTDRAGKSKEVKANAVTLTQSPIFIELH